MARQQRFMSTASIAQGHLYHPFPIPLSLSSVLLFILLFCLCYFSLSLSLQTVRIWSITEPDAQCIRCIKISTHQPVMSLSYSEVSTVQYIIPRVSETQCII